MPRSRNKPKLKIYFAAPTVTSVERREIFGNVKKILFDLGCELTYDWMEDKTEYSPKELVKKTTTGLLKADLVVAEVTFPSTGVGQQIVLAMDRKIPVIAIHAEWKSGANRFLAGSEGELLRFFRYKQDNLKKILSENFKILYKQRLVKFNFISTPEINSDLDKMSEKMGISKSQLVRLILREWIRRETN